MILPPFRLHLPASAEDAVRMAGECGPDFDFLAGGTDLLPNYKNRLNPRGNVIGLSRVASFSEGLRRLSDGSFAIGPMARLADLEADEALKKNFPGLQEAAASVASTLVRQSATLGGNLLVETRCYYFNQSYDWRLSKGFCMKADGDVCLVVPQKEICYAAYAGDTAPVLMTLGALFVLAGTDGARTVAAADFYQPDGIRKNLLARGELIAEIRLPAEAATARSGYMKLRQRDSFDFPDMGVAASLRIDSGRVTDLKVATTAVSMTPVLHDEVTSPLKGLPLTKEAIETVATAVMERSQPVRNVIFPPQYRKRMVGVFTRRLLTRLAGNA